MSTFNDTKNFKFIFIVSFLTRDIFICMLPNYSCNAKIKPIIMESFKWKHRFFVISKFLTQMCSFGHVTHSVGRCGVRFRRMRCFVCKKKRKVKQSNICYTLTNRRFGKTWLYYARKSFLRLQIRNPN